MTYKMKQAAQGLRKAIGDGDYPTLSALCSLLGTGETDITSVGVMNALGFDAARARRGEVIGSMGWWMLEGPLTTIAEEIVELLRGSRKK